MTVADPRQTRAWRKLRDQVIKEEPLCWLRFAGVCTEVSETADHVIPFQQRPDLAMTRSNHRGACHACNRARGHTPVEALNLESSSPALRIFSSC